MKNIDTLLTLAKSEKGARKRSNFLKNYKQTYDSVERVGRASTHTEDLLPAVKSSRIRQSLPAINPGKLGSGLNVVKHVEDSINDATDTLQMKNVGALTDSI